MAQGIYISLANQSDKAGFYLNLQLKAQEKGLFNSNLSTKISKDRKFYNQQNKK